VHAGCHAVLPVGLWTCLQVWPHLVRPGRDNNERVDYAKSFRLLGFDKPETFQAMGHSDSEKGARGQEAG
jgi:hypothetical protein